MNEWLSAIGGQLSVVSYQKTQLNSLEYDTHLSSQFAFMLIAESPWPIADSCYQPIFNLTLPSPLNPIITSLPTHQAAFE